mmetsp:Transcript_64043/g.113648  ORF Transcript_64043/g.113648 Transcript_64043/m.113648 type:complete len:221 (-) Transcript_64043:719-1381(-)
MRLHRAALLLALQEANRGIILCVIHLRHCLDGLHVVLALRCLCRSKYAKVDFGRVDLGRALLHEAHGDRRCVGLHLVLQNANHSGEREELLTANLVALVPSLGFVGAERIELHQVLLVIKERGRSNTQLLTLLCYGSHFCGFHGLGVLQFKLFGLHSVCFGLHQHLERLHTSYLLSVQGNLCGLEVLQELFKCADDVIGVELVVLHLNLWCLPISTLQKE